MTLHSRLAKFYTALTREKTIFAGALMLAMLVGISLYSLLTINYQEFVIKWNSIEAWENYPRNALPSWINIFVSKKLPETIIIDPKNNYSYVKKEYVISEGLKKVEIDLTFDYQYDEFPSDLLIKIFSTPSILRKAICTVTWINPEGEETRLIRATFEGNRSIYPAKDLELLNQLKKGIASILGREPTHDDVIVLLFGLKDESILKRETAQVNKGNYRVHIEVFPVDLEINVDAKLVVYGRVYGFAGTDGYRRDLWLGVLCGTPVALAFGITAALLTALIQLFIGAVSAWAGGVVDFAIQRLTEIFMNIPFLPLLIMISFIYKLDLWTLLLIIIGLSVFGSGVKTSRSLFLSIKESPYIEAAKAYGASGFRIVILYMIPRVLPTIIPGIITSVPYYVFLEASLAIMGVSGTLRSVVTWGRIINDAYSAGALYTGNYHWVLVPSLFFFITSLSFALVGLGLDKILNPKLREM